MMLPKKNNKFGTSITTVHSILHDFEDSHVSGIHERPEQQLLNEQAFPEELAPYLFEKNLIIFLIDAAKKAKLCEENMAFADVGLQLLEAQLLTIQKATQQGERVLLSMQRGENLFQIPNFASVSKSKPFSQLLRFFDDFQEFIQKYLDETLYNYSLGDESRNVKQLLQEAEVNGQKMLQTLQKTLYQFVHNNLASLEKTDLSLICQAQIFLFFTENVRSKFDRAKFGESSNFYQFCVFLTKKSNEEIIEKMKQYVAKV